MRRRKAEGIDSMLLPCLGDLKDRDVDRGVAVDMMARSQGDAEASMKASELDWKHMAISNMAEYVLIHGRRRCIGRSRYGRDTGQCQ